MTYGFGELDTLVPAYAVAIIAIAVRNVSGRRRWLKLDEWLRAGALPIVEFIESEGGLKR